VPEATAGLIVRLLSTATCDCTMLRWRFTPVSQTHGACYTHGVVPASDRNPGGAALKDILERLWRLFPRPRGVEERNILLLYAEVVFAGVLAAAASFNATYILRSGGSATLVGLLSSIPALVAVFLFLPAAQLLERQASYRPLVVWSLLSARIGYLALALLPLITSSGVPEITVAVLVAMAVPSVIFSTGWNPMLADVIPERQRATVFSWRSILSSGTVAALTYLIGLALERGSFPTNYQWLYGIGLVGGLVSTWLVSRVRVRETPPAEVPLLHTRVSLRQGVTDSLQESPRFARLIVNTLVFNLGAWMVGPLYVIYYVQELGATDGWIGLHTTLIHLGIMLGYWAWRRINHRIGDHPALLMALPFAAAYPIMVGVLPYLPALLLVGFLGHLFIPGVDLNHSLIFMRRLPPLHRHTGIAFYSMVMNLGAFVCPIIGVVLAGAIGIRNALILGGVLRAAGVALFYLRPVDEGGVTSASIREAFGAILPARRRYPHV